ncbi:MULTISPECIES: saccharopine dehydrogenase family protein [unclassified Sphingomonas]|uniref:saccharopine dehydrogenase family protein n=1 Tax=Sphingomonas TaxID=13687 RepID=UPI0009616D5A|nr:MULTISPECIES: saccharopine dehydrogenase NADP-binding domain-containing protein [unclassified Sphingomonas]MBN8813680.1 saccharopine dehydrogenase NADP-binding domain-containing protein [Sphingomonas sp.]OJY54100.1 MAG: hypothetical protein BGP17_02985 [Sphingomonas sp. 67-41]
MRLLVLGAGEVGRAFARAVRLFHSFSDVTIADLSEDAAARAASLCGARSMKVDIEDAAALGAILRQHDIVVSTVGPASRFAVPLLRQVIAAGCHFVDVTDDPLPTLDMLALDAAASAAGITAIIGCGASPGIANLLAVHATSQLDRVDRLITIWGSRGDEKESPGNGVTAALRHWVEQISMPIPVWRNGGIVSARPLERVEVNYPGIGRVSTRLVGHPEAITLPRKYPSLQECLNVMDFSGYVNAALARAARGIRTRGLTIDEAAARLAAALDEQGGRFRPRDATSYIYHGIADVVRGKKWLPPLSAVAEGWQGRRQMVVGAALNGVIPGGTGFLTALPAVIVADMIVGRTIKRSGVATPEQLVDPEAFFFAIWPFLIDDQGAPLSTDEPAIAVTTATTSSPIRRSRIANARE